MKKLTEILKQYQPQEWLFIKIPFISIFLLFIAKTILLSKPANYPLGFCKLIDCNIFLFKPVAIIILFIAIIFSILYLFEKVMLLSLTILFITSLLVFTISDSTGIFARTDVLTMVLFAQLIAYLYAYFSKNAKTYLYKNRIQFPIQVIAAGYTLSALSKLINSGILWSFNYRGLAIQAKKAIGYKYLFDGSEVLLQKMETFPNFIISHPVLIIFILTLSVLFELFAGIAVFKKKYAFYWGLLLMCMHLGIYFFMNVMILPVIISMIAFFINPLYILYKYLIPNEK